MSVVYSDHSQVPSGEETHKFVYFLPYSYSITVETDDVQLSRDVGILLGETFKKAGLARTQELAQASVIKGRELNVPITWTLKQEATIN